MSPVPTPILKALNLPTDPKTCTLDSSDLGSGFTSTAILHATIPTETNSVQQRKYFIKTSQDGPAAKEMFHGEFESLNAIAAAVPGFCPRGLAWGPLDEKNGYFLATEFLDLRNSRNRNSSRGWDETNPSTSSLAYRLTKLHTTPAPADPVTGRSRYGFPVPTFCGDTRQSNTFYDSWADFYANERLLTILCSSEKRNGRDPGLRDAVEKTANIVVPRLLGDEHLGYNSRGEGVGIQPVVVHGDLWSVNADWGRIVGSGDEEEDVGDVVYDPSACYAHSEYELGIMSMFGGFGRRFFEDYHRVVPRTEPVEEYGDRVRLYELYHHLNHHAIFGGGYRSGAMLIMQKLLRKYSDRQ